LKHILRYSDLFESTSAGSQDRGSADLPPFKFAINFDSRLGYTKHDFCQDLTEIYLGYSGRNRKELMDVVFKSAGIFKISDIKNLPQDRVDQLIKDIENYMESKSEYKLEIFPDGFILCFENIRHRRRLCDLYYSPSERKIKISYTESYPENEDLILDMSEFSPISVGIDPKDFSSTIEKCDNYLEKIK
jgi:hypothetical protein